MLEAGNGEREIERETERETESGQSSHCLQEEQSRAAAAVGSHHEKGSHWPTDVATKRATVSPHDDRKLPTRTPGRFRNSSMEKPAETGTL